MSYMSVDRYFYKCKEHVNLNILKDILLLNFLSTQKLLLALM